MLDSLIRVSRRGVRDTILARERVQRQTLTSLLNSRGSKCVFEVLPYTRFLHRHQYLQRHSISELRLLENLVSLTLPFQRF